jgi:carbohydrate-selective porin OprB
MYNGAWDYPADVHGYSWGWVHEFHARNWSVRYGSAAEPRVANGLRFDRRLLRNHANLFEGEARFALRSRPGVVRLLGFLHRTNSGTYADSIRLGEQTGTIPDITATRRNGTLKYGAGMNFEQEITGNFGIFGRVGWNDGKTESFAFTAIDRLAGLGGSFNGARWKRKADTAGSVFTLSGLSGVHALYLARGGLDFIIGDGALHYGLEKIWETYYRAQVVPGVFTTIDVQRIVNPAYNQDRGPLWVGSLRLHVELSKDRFVSRSRP